MSFMDDFAVAIAAKQASAASLQTQQDDAARLRQNDLINSPEALSSARFNNTRSGLLPAESASNIALQGANAGLIRTQAQYLPMTATAQAAAAYGNANQSNASGRQALYGIDRGINPITGAEAPEIGAKASVGTQADKPTGAGFGYNPSMTTAPTPVVIHNALANMPFQGLPAPSVYRRPNYGLQQPVDISSSRPSVSKGMLGDPALDDAFHVRYAPVAR